MGYVMKLWKCVVAAAASFVISSGNLFAQEIVKIGLPMPLTGGLATVSNQVFAAAQLTSTVTERSPYFVRTRALH